MFQLPLPISRIDEAQKNRIINDGFNPPRKPYNQEEFEAILQRLCRDLRAALPSHWRCGFEDPDYHAHTVFNNDMMLCVEIANRRIITDVLLPTAVSAVLNLKSRCCVDFCDAWSVLTLEDGTFYPSFNILISPDQIWIYAEDDEFFDAIGCTWLKFLPPTEVL